MNDNITIFSTTIKDKEYEYDSVITENGYTATNTTSDKYKTFFINNSQEGLSTKITVSIKEEDKENAETYVIDLDKINFNEPVFLFYNIRFNDKLQKEINDHIVSGNKNTHIHPTSKLSYSYTLAYYITSALTINKDLIIPLLTDFNTVSNRMKWRIIDSIINMVEQSNLKKKNDEKVEEKVQKLEDFVKNNF